MLLRSDMHHIHWVYFQESAQSRFCSWYTYFTTNDLLCQRNKNEMIIMTIWIKHSISTALSNLIQEVSNSLLHDIYYLY